MYLGGLAVRFGVPELPNCLSVEVIVHRASLSSRHGYYVQRDALLLPLAVVILHRRFSPPSLFARSADQF